MMPLDPYEPSVPLVTDDRTFVEWDDGNDRCEAHRNLACRGPDPWVVVRSRGNLYRACSIHGRSVSVGGMRAAGMTVVLIDSACGIAPMNEDRHSADADALRRKAGMIIVGIRDAMIRARMLDELDGWLAVTDPARLIDDDPAHGQLYTVDPGLGLTPGVVLLVVTCPSTKRRYAHLIPIDARTAQAAREWMMAGNIPLVET